MDSRPERVAGITGEKRQQPSDKNRSVFLAKLRLHAGLVMAWGELRNRVNK